MFPSHWIAFDCETTGLLPHARLIEIGAVAFSAEGEILCEFHRFARPPGRIPALVTELTGITTSMLSEAPRAGDAILDFFRWLPPEAVMFAHNVSFDLAVIAGEAPDAFAECPGQFADSLILARALGEFPHHRLPTIAKILGNSFHRRSHRALDDAHAVRQLVLHALSRGLHQHRPILFTGKPASHYFSSG